MVLIRFLLSGRESNAEQTQELDKDNLVAPPHRSREPHTRKEDHPYKDAVPFFPVDLDRAPSSGTPLGRRNNGNFRKIMMNFVPAVFGTVNVLRGYQGIDSAYWYSQKAVHAAEYHSPIVMAVIERPTAAQENIHFFSFSHEVRESEWAVYHRNDPEENHPNVLDEDSKDSVGNRLLAADLLDDFESMLLDQVI